MKEIFLFLEFFIFIEILLHLFIIKNNKKKRFAWDFFQTAVQSVQRSLNSLFQRSRFLMFPLFQKYLNPG